MKKKLFTVLSLLVIASFLLTGCFYSGVSEASCAYVVGDGYPDSDVDEVYYPGEEIPQASTDHVIKYVPCGDRNYLINDGSQVSNGISVGDEIQLLKAKTSTGTDILIAVSSYFQLNQNKEAMKAFFKYQYKFGAASDRDVSGGEINNSTEGWLDMLGETFGPAMARSAREGAFLTTDAIWQNGDTAQIAILQQYMVESIKEKLRAPTGYNNIDFFCGANASGWPDPKKPGEGEFYCAPIEIVIDYVIKNPDQSNSSTQGSISLSQQRLQVAQELYGPNAYCWLGLQDLVQACANAGSTCVFNFSGNVCQGGIIDDGPPAVIIPSPTSVPTELVPTATP
ncbi:hypothetical protein A3K29_05700 [Candidatus Collierbacteria bacterium RIFOXYB2_FULL_46_14]|uniref:Lipoprotein n=1 Tax=Candidatus Collierbacteria bacterium GW2011_GWA2_46_26 TaxID=1618381 RepID=A0A0G1PIN8_9BACT|nr:MAG: hypothetical protein UX47_C0009G0019 [Candidatus Collierbacteria bacterium GW2011_GWA2_46_26]OGD73583.1 MAG: hypothetical protein A3K29_05700 [Candidatus Collierbacteria bacterium RIFOXYB2_FULL_46_14]OGD76625.1 MAG: hypothetical protein A3K43_05700 [Candidatus Collierbacteria bacterium RIFOXYA2_FULL_46_20]OGD77961.1 MAG: hypothetical protein A3K39_05700 [Candidatus Collierbacteria bacterium RIFOXYC2_FULL_43_15]OGD79985.1 MAG: hypothetical protein A2320_00130 [Pseudomonadales bacterium G